MAKPQILTLRQVAVLAKTSKSTVSRFLTGDPRVSPEAFARIEKVIREKGFTPSLFARGLAGGRTGMVGVVTGMITGGFYADVLHGMSDGFQSRQTHLMVTIAHGADDFPSAIDRLLGSKLVDGLILIAPPGDLFTRPFPKSERPHLLVASRAARTTKAWAAVPSISGDNAGGFEQLMGHLHATGHRTFLHVAGPEDNWEAGIRRRTFESFLAAHPDTKGTVLPSNLGERDGRQAFESHLDRVRTLPHAIVCFNDANAWGVLTVLASKKIENGKDVTVTGCDDEPASLSLGLTTIHIPNYEIGRQASDMLHRRLQDSSPAETEHRLVETRLVLRKTRTSF